MSEKENSVLFSLRELRSIEDDRVKQEEAAAQAKVEAERRAQEDAVRRAKAEEERKRIEEDERRVRLEHEKERQIREEKNRLEEAERKARIEAQAKLEEARIQAEIQARAHIAAKKPPVKAIVGSVIGVLILAGGALGYTLGVYLPEQKRIQAEELEAKAKRELQKAIDRVKADLSAEYDAKIANEQDESKKKLLIAEKARKEAEQEAALKARMRPRSSGTTKPEGPKQKPTFGKTNCKDPNDPLCGTEGL